MLQQKSWTLAALLHMKPSGNKSDAVESGLPFQPKLIRFSVMGTVRSGGGKTGSVCLGKFDIDIATVFDAHMQSNSHGNINSINATIFEPDFPFNFRLRGVGGEIRAAVVLIRDGLIFPEPLPLPRHNSQQTAAAVAYHVPAGAAQSTTVQCPVCNAQVLIPTGQSIDAVIAQHIDRGCSPELPFADVNNHYSENRATHPQQGHQNAVSTSTPRTASVIYRECPICSTQIPIPSGHQIDVVMSAHIDSGCCPPEGQHARLLEQNPIATSSNVQDTAPTVNITDQMSFFF